MWVSVLMTYPATIAIIAETFGQYLMEGLRQSYDIEPSLQPVVQKLFGISLLCELNNYSPMLHFYASRRMLPNKLVT